MPSFTETKSHENVLVDQPKADTSMPYPTKGKLVLIMLCLVLGIFLVAVDTTIISVAIPTISTNFKALDDVGWYGSAYFMTLTIFQPMMGNIYKNFAPKATYTASIALFEVGTILCAAGPASYVFILGRAVAGLGAAGLLQGALAIITYIAPLEKRQLYIGSVVSVFGISASGGPILGGVLCSRTSWRWCFWINVPMGVAVLVLVFSSFKLSGSDHPRQKLPFRTKLGSLDPLGIVLLLGSVCSLLLMLQQGGNTWPWKSAKVIGLLFSFAILLALFGIVQWKLSEKATIPLRLLKNRTVLMGSLFLALSNASSYVIPFILLGQPIGSVGTGFLTTLSLSTPTKLWAIFMVLAGWGTGMGENIPYIAIQAAIESEDDVFTGSGIATFVALLGGALAISIGSTVLDNSVTHFVRLLAPSILPSAVLSAGPLSLPSLTTSPAVLVALRQAYAKTIDNVMIFALALTCSGVPVACGMRWFNIKVVAANRKRTREQLRREQEVPERGE